MEKIRLVLIGLGGYGAMYARSMAEKRPGDVEIVGLVDPFPEGCPYLEALLATGAPLYATAQEFFDNHTADLAAISTPIQFHTEQIILALEHGANVICEKPLCGDAKDIEKIIAARDKAGKFVDIGYQWSHSEAIQLLKKDLVDGVYGAPKRLKSFITAPRDKTYFRRGTGWAGKKRSADGALIYDSVANNATAHYLHNMFFLMGKTMETSLAPVSTQATLMRAYPIENFDTCVINCKMPGDVEALFIAAHPVDIACGMIGEWTYEKGTVYAYALGHPSMPLAPGAIENRIVGVLADGTVKDYGDARGNQMRKLFLAIDAVRHGRVDVMCPPEAAAVHTQVINDIQETCEIRTFREELIYEDENVIRVKGLYEALVNRYHDDSEDFSALLNPPTGVINN